MKNIYKILILAFAVISMLIGSALANNDAKARISGDKASTAKNQVKGVTVQNSQMSTANHISSPNAFDVINDGGFEAGSPSSAWNEFSSNFGTPLCTAGACGTGGGTGPHAGTWWAWFGGIDAVDEIGSVDQDVIIPPGTANLSFYLEIPAAATSGFMKVVMDSDTLMTLTNLDSQAYATYAQVNIDVSTYADSLTHNLKFYSKTFAGGVTNFFIDDVVLDIVTDIDNPVANAPSGFGLLQNYPNPFNPTTTIAYQLPGHINVVLKVYNFAGQEIKTLVNERQSAGLQEVVWDGLDGNGNEVASGIYMYRLRAGNHFDTKKMILLK